MRTAALLLSLLMLSGCTFRFAWEPKRTTRRQPNSWQEPGPDDGRTPDPTPRPAPDGGAYAGPDTRPGPGPTPNPRPRPTPKPDPRPARDDSAKNDPPPPLPAGAIGKVLEVARDHIGKPYVRVNKVTFRYDCSGFVRGVFSVLGVDLMILGAELPDANGVLLIHSFLARHGGNHNKPLPALGDVVYFDNTWDKNGNGRLDDPLTHIGIVDGVDDDGTIHIIHRTNSGIVRDAMNLRRPGEKTDGNGKVINNLLRPNLRKDVPGTPHLLGELFAGFGTVTVPGGGPVAEVLKTLLFADLPRAAEGGPGGWLAPDAG